MDTTITPEALATRKRLGMIQVISALLYLISLPVVDHLNSMVPGIRGVRWVQYGVVLLRCLALAGFCWASYRLKQKDELQRLMDSQALAFAFLGMLIAVVVIDQLERIALVPALVWTNSNLSLVMIALYIAGLAWSKLRYR